MQHLRNSVQLIGRLGKDVELSETANGVKKAKFSLATNEYYKDSQGEKVQKTYWHNIVAYGKTAELMSNAISKGDEVMLSGKLTYWKYESEDGQTRYFPEVVANEFLRVSQVREEKIPF